MQSTPITLIADAGSTKIDWALLRDKECLIRFQTAGINALIAPADEIRKEIDAVAEKISPFPEPDKILYYGAGCATPAIYEKMGNLISDKWGKAEVIVESDLVGAARSLLGKRRGIACILGTGSNSALYDGLSILSNISPLGYILGDEGSGTALGKRLITEVFKGEMEDKLRNFFTEECEITLPTVLDRVYRSDAPNKFLASLVPFIRKQVDVPFIHNMVVDEFRKFLRRNPALYPDARSLPLSFTGSVACYFEPQLREAATLENFSISKITKSPMEGLIDFHSSL